MEGSEEGEVMTCFAELNESFFDVLARQCEETARSCAAVAEEYRTLVAGSKRRRRQAGEEENEGAAPKARRKRTGSAKQPLLPPGVWSADEVATFEEGIARWGLSSPDAIAALLPSRPADEVNERLATARRVRSWDDDDDVDEPGSNITRMHFPWARS